MVAIKLQEKKSIVKHLRQLTDASLSIMVVEYKGLHTAQMTDLRVKARPLGVQIVVVRNSLARFALQDTKHICLSEHLRGNPFLLVFSEDNPGAVARLVQDFSKENKEMKVKALSVDGHFFAGEQLDEVANLPNYDQAIALLMRTMLAPAQKLAQTMTEVYGKLVRTVFAIGAQKQQQ